MKYLKTCVCTISLALLFNGSAFPAESPGDLPADRALTLQECVEYALAHHNSILGAEKDVVASKAGTRQARAGYLPRITASSDYAQSGYEGQQVGTGFRRVGTFTSEQTTLGLSETFYDGGRTRMAIRQAFAGERVSNAELESARQQRVLAVIQAYFDVLLSRRLADIAAQTVAEAEKQIELIRARIDAGDAARVDIYPVQVQRANARLQKLQADNSVRIAANALRNVIGLGKGPELRLSDVEEPTFKTPVLDDCLECALRDRPEVARSAAQVDSTRAALSYARSQTLPVPTANVNYDRGLSGSGYDSQWSIGFGVNMSIFDGGASRAEVDAGSARLESAVLSADQLSKDIATEVEEAHLNLTNALERLTASKANVELARTNLEVANTKYEQGLAIPLEIVTAQVSYADAQAGSAQALYDCYVARAQLDKAMGKRG